MTEALRTRIEGQYRTERAAVMEAVARERGLPFQTLAKPGDSYTDIHGNMAKLPDGITLVSFVVDRQNLGSFWNRVNEKDTSTGPFSSPRKAPDAVSAVEKAGRELGFGYMLDPKNEAPLAVLDDTARPLREIRPQPINPLRTGDLE